MIVSIITLSFNSENTIVKTIESILKQDYLDIEHVFIDNCSSDNTINLIHNMYESTNRKYKLISEKDKGISDGFNKGILNSTGEVIVFLNSDDSYIGNDVISRVMEIFEGNSVDFVHGDMIFEDKYFGTNIRKPLLCSLEYALPYNHPTFFVRRRVYDEIGLFDLKYKFTMDYDLICRMYKTPDQPKFKGVYLKGEPLVKMMAGGVSWKYELRSIIEVEEILEKYAFLTPKAKAFQRQRKFRIRLKSYLARFGLSSFVKMWRRLKWDH
ncbi:MAG: glycosyltransferase [Halobacteriovoraceae bacterium]|nr:glycosyltransferase [Halobacteriovoraceae bacterium]